MTEPNPEWCVEEITESVPFSGLDVKMVTFQVLEGDGRILFSGYVALSPGAVSLCVVERLGSRDQVKCELLIKLGNLHDAVGNLFKKVNHG